MGEGRYVPPEAREKQFNPPTELTTEDELVDFWRTFYRNNDVNLPVNSREAILGSTARKSLREQSEEKNPKHYFGITENEKVIATGMAKVLFFEGVKYGYLGLQTVDKEYRGKGLAKKITDVSTEFAKKEGCTDLMASVICDNPIGLVTKFNDGFCLKRVELYDENDEDHASLFSLTKKIDNTTNYDRKEEVGELEEVLLSDLKIIEDRIKDGWVGIDIKNLGDVKDEDPNQWKLIMERVKE